MMRRWLRRKSGEVRNLRECKKIETLGARGAELRGLIGDAVRARGLEEHFRIVGRDQCLSYETRDQKGQHSAAFRTLFLQETIRRGLLAPSFVISYAHTSADVSLTAEIVDDALEVYGQALEQGVDTLLEGRPVLSVYRRFN